MELKNNPRNKYIRFNTPGTPHGLTFSCYQNQKIFKFRRTCECFIQALKKARKKHNFHIWAYVIMPDHVHLLIFPCEGDYSISDILSSIKHSTSKRVINWVKRNRPQYLKNFETEKKHHPYRFWQDGGGYDRNIRNHAELIRFVNYVHNNPVRRGLVNDPTEWYWSSAGAWLLDLKGPVEIDKISFPIL